MEISYWMTRNPKCVRPRDTLAKARDLMTRGGFRRLPVVEGDNMLVGMISESDVRQHLGHLAETRVNAAMASNLLAISEFDTAEEAAEVMLQHKIGGLPVIRGARVVGIVSTTDLPKALVRVVKATGDILNE